MKCRGCGGQDTLCVLDLGSHPPSNALMLAESSLESEKKFQLKVFICKKCWLMQTVDVVNRGDLFSDDYPYFSSFAQTFVKHLKTYVNVMVRDHNINTASTVLEIGSNDGCLQNIFRRHDISVLGVEPTRAAAKIAINQGHKVIGKFFDRGLAGKIMSEHGKFDLLVANNVLAHVPDINDFLQGIQLLLSNNGFATIENPSLVSLLKNGQFDTIYHEHFSYLSTTSVKFLSEQNGLELFDVQSLPIHGGSNRYFLKTRESKVFSINPSVQKLLDDEEKQGLKSLPIYDDFRRRSLTIKKQSQEFVLENALAGKTIVAYGAAAKGNTFLNFCGFTNSEIKYLVDKNPEKIGRFAPGSGIPIVGEHELLADKPDFIMILPWNLKNEIMAQLSYVRSWGCKFVCASPVLSIS